MSHSDFVFWFHEIEKSDVDIVGVKGAALGDLQHAGFTIPEGFIISNKAYFSFIRENNLTVKINHLLATVDYSHLDSIAQVSQHIKKLIINASLSEKFIHEIVDSYKKMSALFSESLVTVSTSITSENSDKSYKEQNNIFTQIKGDANLFIAIKQCWASLFEPHALLYRYERELDQFSSGTAVVVQRIILADKSGIMYSQDPETNNKAIVIINALLGIKSSTISKDLYYDKYEINKLDLFINKKQIVPQESYLRYSGSELKEVQNPITNNHIPKLSDQEIVELTELCKRIEHYYYFPQECEWVIKNKQMYIVKIKNMTPKIIKNETSIVKIPLITGVTAEPGIASGHVKIINSPHDIASITHGDIIVTSQVTKAYVPAMKKANATIIESSDTLITSLPGNHVIGTPVIIGAEYATSKLKNGNVITVNGRLGQIFKGGQISKDNAPIHQFSKTVKTATKVYVNLNNPKEAVKIAQLNVDGVGMLRAENIFSHIGVHPKRMLRDGKGKEYSNLLAEQIELVAKAFYPRPVSYRSCDFTSSEYRTLNGGKDYEPIESNPLLGYRGAFRNIHDPEVFELELESIKIVRNKRNLKNVSLIIPFIRTVRELIDMKRIITSTGLYRSPTFHIFMMCEIPSNIILLDQFIHVGIDGVAIGSRDLTMLLLGVDRQNSEVSHVYNEQNDAVVWAYEQAIKTCMKHSLPISICEQAPHLYPVLLEKLIRWGMTSVTVTPNEVDIVREHIVHIEKSI